MFDWSSLVGDLSGFGNVGEGGLNVGMGGVTPPSFADRFNAAQPQGVNPMVPGAPPASPISPEHLASSAAARGIPPPPVDLGPTDPMAPPMRMPGEAAVQNWRNDTDMVMGRGPGDVGAALTGKTVGAPMDIKSEPQKQSEAQAGQPQEKSAGDKFAETLKGLKAPPGPELQRLSTPAAPRPTNAIKGGEFMALLQMLNSAPGGSSYNLPSTLGAALRR